MARWGQIQNDKVHWVFEADAPPYCHPSIIFINLDAHPEVMENDTIDTITGAFITGPRRRPASVHSDPDKTAEEKAAINAALKYKRDRLEKYPAIGNQLDALWHMIDNGEPLDKTSSFYTMIKMVKDTYPKTS